MSRGSALPAFLAIMLADFLVRTAYMTGKSPVLPIFADQLGASEILLGLILAISSCTGMILKPVFGFLSDRQGQWIWLMIGTALFAFTPLLYLGIASTETLFALRIIHGLATAIYGPVTLAFVAGLGAQTKAERFGWFGMSRSAGYILGPLLGGFLLTVMSPTLVLASTSGIAILSFLPVLYLRQAGSSQVKYKDHHPRKRTGDLLKSIITNRPLLAFGMAELTSRIGVYAVKTFIPLVVLSSGGTVIQAGVFLSIQELAVVVTRPIAGRMADQLNMPNSIATIGLLLVAIALGFVPHAANPEQFAMVAVAFGIGNGAYYPAAMTLIANAAEQDTRGLSFGVVGALRNLGKLLGPVCGGVLLYCFSDETAFIVLGALTALAIIPLSRGSVFRTNANSVPNW